MNDPSPGYYAVIPADVRYSDVEASAKLLYGEISALANKEGYCYASNGYFSALYKVHEKTISGWISSLVKAGFIRLEIDQKSTHVRRIFLGQVYSVKPAQTYTRKHGELPVKSRIAGSEITGRTTCEQVNKTSAERANGACEQLPNTTLNTKENKNTATPGHTEFVKMWHEAYKLHFGRDYRFQGRDFPAVKRLLTETKKTPSELADMAKLAWRYPAKFNCKQAVTVFGFDARYNDILGELPKQSGERIYTAGANGDLFP